MGNGQTKGWPPTGVVTIVLAGGRVEEYRRPMLASDVMLLHPRHHVVKPDFFRSSRVVVLRPEEVLVPGHKFFLVPFRTVYKKLRRRTEVNRSPSSNCGKLPTCGGCPGVEVLRSSSSSTSGQTQSSGGWPRVEVLRRSSSFTSTQSSTSGGSTRVYQKGAVMDINSSRSVGRSRCTGVGKIGLCSGSSATRSPARRAALAMKRSSPRRRSQSSPRRRRRPSIEYENYARRKSSLQSQMREQDDPSADFTENESIESADFTELAAFRSPDFADCNNAIESSVGVRKQAESCDLSVPEYELFKTPEMRSPEEGLGSCESAMATVTGHEFFEAMDCCFESEMNANEPTLLTPAPVSDGRSPVPGMVQEMMDYQGPDSGQSEEMTRNPLLLIAAPSVSDEFHGIVQAWIDQGISEEGFSRFNKPGRRAASLDWKSMQEMLTSKIALHSEQVISDGHRHKGLEQQSPSSASGVKRIVRKEPERRLNTSGQAINHSGRHNGLGQQPPSSPSVVKKLVSQEPKRSLPTNGHALTHSSRRNCLGQQPPSSRSGDTQIGSQERERGLTRRSEPQQQPQEKVDQGGCLQELQLFYRGGGKTKDVKVEAQDNRLSKSSADAQVGPKPLAALVKQPEIRVSIQQRSPMTLAKQRKPYRLKFIQHLCFSSSQVPHSPLRLPVPVAGNNQGKKTIAANRLKLIDHLNLDPPPPHDQNNRFKQPASTKANNVPLPQFRHFDMSQSVNRRELGPAQQEFLTLQISRAVRNQCDPALRPKDVNQMSPKTSIEDKFLKMPAACIFRHRGLKTRSGIVTVTNWKPKLPPLVESPP